ncbi:hypothetical protein AAU01_15600 [Paenarthrobacter aurescens]|uniref:Flavin-nucleotide-binding protein n=2 Tax=Paenarthrobacter aurescens TaxID=43663 RepID=A0A4Y3NEF5_PAEAU|nr:hypothetical protein AAU01_15600 [Paenarthrobacter aurescens]
MWGLGTLGLSCSAMYARHMSTVEEPSEVQILKVHECWRLLRSNSVGRLAVSGGSGPEIFPVNYFPEDGTLILRTAPGTKMDALMGQEPVALEADGFNSYGTIAWSVVAKGLPEAIPADDPSQESAAHGLSPWEPGTKDFLFRITPTELTGRRFVISDSKRWWPAREPLEAP